MRGTQSGGVHQGHTILPVRSPGKLAFREGQWDASNTKTYKVPEETAHAGVNYVEQSVIGQAITGEIVLMHCVEAKR